MISFSYDFTLRFILRMLLFFFFWRHLKSAFRSYLLPVLRDGIKRERAGWKLLHETHNDLLAEKIEKEAELVARHSSLLVLKKKLESWRAKTQESCKREADDAQKILELVNARHSQREERSAAAKEAKQAGEELRQRVLAAVYKKFEGEFGKKALSRMLTKLPVVPS